MAPRANEHCVQDSDGEHTEGLAKGVFVFSKRKASAANTPRSKLKRARSSKSAAAAARKKKKAGAAVENAVAHVDAIMCQEFMSREPKYASERVSVYNELMKSVESKVDAIQNKIFQGVYDSVVNFVRNSQKMRDQSCVRSIPTAVLLTGVNMPDHTKILDTMINRLKDLTPHISVLHSGQNMKQLVANLVLDIVNPSDDEMEDDDGCGTLKKSDASFGYLEEWYANQYPSGGQGEDRPPIVLLAQDFENFTGASLCDLITLCGRYQSSLPIVFILGVATTLDAVHKTLPQAVTSQLTISTFGSPNSTLHLYEVIDAIIIDPEVPFKLSEKVLGYLVENFLYHDFSINRFLSAYRFVLAEHLFRQPGSILLTEENKMFETINSMDMEELEFLCRLNSFRNYVEKLDLKDQAEVLTNVNVCRKTLAKLLKEYLDCLKTFTAMVKVLYCLTKDLPRRPLGGYLRIVYQEALTGNLLNSPKYREAFQFLKLTAPHDLEEKLKIVLTEVEGLESLKGFAAQISDSLKKLADIKNNPDAYTSSPITSVPGTPALPGSLNTSGITPLAPRNKQSPSKRNSSTLNDSAELATPQSTAESAVNRSSPRKFAKSAANSPKKTPSNLATTTDRATRNNSPLKQSSTPMDTSTGGVGSVGGTPTFGSTPMSAGFGSPSLGRALSRFDRMNAGLLDLAHRNSMQHQSRPYDLVRSEVMEIINTNLKQFLKSPCTSARPLYEAFTFTAVGVLRRHLTGTPRASLHTALTDPYVYLRHPDLKISDPGEIPASLPDVSIAYKLHLECPRLINIYDWLSCWHSIATQGDANITKVGQARFTRSVSELQHLGFIKTSNRKADHVARLTFGGS